MRKALVSLLLLAGCASAGTYDPAVAQRVAADLTCVNQLALDGFAIYSQPPIGGVVTAAHVVSAIQSASSVTQAAANACGTMLKNIGYDMKALKAKVEADKAKIDAAKAKKK